MTALPLLPALELGPAVGESVAVGGGAEGDVVSGAVVGAGVAGAGGSAGVVGGAVGAADDSDGDGAGVAGVLPGVGVTQPAPDGPCASGWAVGACTGGELIVVPDTTPGRLSLREGDGEVVGHGLGPAPAPGSPGTPAAPVPGLGDEEVTACLLSTLAGLPPPAPPPAPAMPGWVTPFPPVSTEELTWTSAVRKGGTAMATAATDAAARPASRPSDARVRARSESAGRAALASQDGPAFPAGTGACRRPVPVTLVQAAARWPIGPAAQEAGSCQAQCPRQVHCRALRIASVAMLAARDWIGVPRVRA